MLSHGEEIKIWKVAKVYLTDNPVTKKLLVVVLKRNKGYLLIDTNKFPNRNTYNVVQQRSEFTFTKDYLGMSG